MTSLYFGFFIVIFQLDILLLRERCSNKSAFILKGELDQCEFQCISDFLVPAIKICVIIYLAIS